MLTTATDCPSCDFGASQIDLLRHGLRVFRFVSKIDCCLPSGGTVNFTVARVWPSLKTVRNQSLWFSGILICQSGSDGMEVFMYVCVFVCTCVNVSMLCHAWSQCDGGKDCLPSGAV